MLKRESDFWDELRDNCSKHLDPVHWQRIESNEGVPDVNACWAGVEAWLELKVIEKGWQIPHYRATQANWLHRRWESGGRSFLAVRVRKPMFCGLIVWPGKHARDVRTYGIRVALPLATLVYAEPIPWDQVSLWLFYRDRGERCDDNRNRVAIGRVL